MRSLLRVRLALLTSTLFVVAACGGPYRAYPRWTLDSGTHFTHDCLDADAFVRASGKAGVGMTVALRSHATCPVRVVRAELIVDDLRVPATLPPMPPLPGRSLAYLWLPFEFDNNAAWNERKRDGRFELDVAIGDAPPVTWTIPAHHAFEHGRWSDGSNGGV